MVFRKKNRIKSYIIVRGWIFPSEKKWDLKTEIYGLNSENCKYHIKNNVPNVWLICCQIHDNEI